MSFLFRLPWELQESICQYLSLEETIEIVKLGKQFYEINPQPFLNIEMYDNLYLKTCCKMGMKRMIDQRNIPVIITMLQMGIVLTQFQMLKCIEIDDPELIKCIAKTGRIDKNYKNYLIYNEKYDILKSFYDTNCFVKYTNDGAKFHGGQINHFPGKIKLTFEMIGRLGINHFVNHSNIMSSPQDLDIWKIILEESFKIDRRLNNPFNIGRYGKFSLSRKDILEMGAVKSGKEAILLFQKHGIKCKNLVDKVIASPNYTLEYFNWYLSKCVNEKHLEKDYHQIIILAKKIIKYDRFDLVDWISKYNVITKDILNQHMSQRMAMLFRDQIDFNKLLATILSTPLTQKFKQLDFKDHVELLKYCYEQGGRVEFFNDTRANPTNSTTPTNPDLPRVYLREVLFWLIALYKKENYEDVMHIILKCDGGNFQYNHGMLLKMFFKQTIGGTCEFFYWMLKNMLAIYEPATTPLDPYVSLKKSLILADEQLGQLDEKLSGNTFWWEDPELLVQIRTINPDHPLVQPRMSSAGVNVTLDDYLLKECGFVW